MSMKQAQVLEATKAAPNSNGRRTAGIQIERIRVAAYCRVSTDGDEQLGSFESQKAYYEQKIKQNKEWVSAGIFADEAITGTKVDKREGFQEMIRKCQNGEIDMILTKSISRFSRNTQDIIKYVRMLRDRNIAIVFEKENINTLDMNGEMLLTILSSLSQGEVESLSENVKMGLKMKMKRGELVGFNGCLGYDYHPDTKSITVNEQEDYDEKKLSFQRKLHQMTEEKAYLDENSGQQKNVSKRMDQLRKTLENEDILDEFDRIVFESIVEKVIVGGYDENGNPSPYKLTFVLKCNQDLKVNDAKAEYRSKQKGKKVS